MKGENPSRTKPPGNWTPDIIERFVKAWNDGVNIHYLRERFRVDPRWAVVTLRKRGFPLANRSRGKQPIS